MSNAKSEIVNLYYPQKIPKMECNNFLSYKDKYYLGKNHPKIFFTRQEAMCMLYLLMELNDAQIAIALDLSVTLVNYHIESMLQKLECEILEELVEKVRTTRFMYSLKELWDSQKASLP